MNQHEAFPLSWPVDRTRTKHPEPARFAREVNNRRVQLTRLESTERLVAELERLGALDVVISTNVGAKSNGMPYSSGAEPQDRGVAVYFKLYGDKKPYCLACDKWDRVADNLAAIAAHIAAMRGQERWGVGTTAQAFAGYAALPPKEHEQDWWLTLGFKAPPALYATVRNKYLELAGANHPDQGGDTDQMASFNKAIAAAKVHFGFTNTNQPAPETGE